LTLPYRGRVILLLRKEAQDMFSGTKYLILAAIILGYMSLAVPAEAALLQVTPAQGETLPADTAEKVTVIKNVTKVRPPDIALQ
jgi:hypothetical protein